MAARSALLASILIASAALSAVPAQAIAGTPTCDQLQWLPTFSGARGGVNGFVRALTVFDDGSGGGPGLYAGGAFTTAGGVAVNFIAKWNGTSWSALGSGMDFNVDVLTVFDDGSGGGPALYAGGGFSTAGGVSAHNIAKWNGTSWSALGAGMNGNPLALTVFDDGSGGGPALYVGGPFDTVGGVTINAIAKWNGTSWSALGSGMTGSEVYALTVFNDGSGGGPALYAGGLFTTAGGVAANRIAKWNGTSWSALGTGMNAQVRALTVFDDGSGPKLYAGGSFITAGGAGANRIAKWNGTSWSAVGSGMNSDVSTLFVFDDGSVGGQALCAGGVFTTAGGVGANFIAKWNGTSWSALGSGMNFPVFALTDFDDGSGGGPALYAGGDFTGSPAGDSFLAKWGCPATPIITGDLNGDGIVNSLDLGILLSAWSIPPRAPGCGGTLPCAADLNGDGVVNSLDLGILLANWTL